MGGSNVVGDSYESVYIVLALLFAGFCEIRKIWRATEKDTRVDL